MARTEAFAGFGCAGLSVAFFIAVWMGSRTTPDAVPVPDQAPPIAAPAPPPALPPTPVRVEEPREWLYVHGEVDVRAEPDRNAAVVARLRRGSRVQLGAPDPAGWSRLYARDAPDGYVYRASALLAANAPAKDEEPLIYHRGPRGGCYYVVEPSGDKKYVNRSRCD